MTEPRQDKPLREHAPGHPVWTQAGPSGMYSQGCKVPGCDWFTMSRGGP